MTSSNVLANPPLRSRKAQALGLIAWLGVVFSVAAVGAAASLEASSFYTALQRPRWAPPAWVFGPVWTMLYALMGIAAWMVWRAGPARRVRAALAIFLAQLALNGLWTWLFFSWRLGAWSVVDIVLLWVMIVATLIMFWRIRPLAAALLIPYLLWVTYAAALNVVLWRNNPAIL